MTTITARNHRSPQNCNWYRRPERTWAPSTAVRRLTRRQTTTPSTPMMNPREYILCRQRQPNRRHPESWKRIWAWEFLLQKEGECRSTSAKTADRWSPQQRTSHVHQRSTRTLRTFKLRQARKPKCKRFSFAGSTWQDSEIEAEFNDLEIVLIQNTEVETNNAKSCGRRTFCKWTQNENEMQSIGPRLTLKNTRLIEEDFELSETIRCLRSYVVLASCFFLLEQGSLSAIACSKTQKLLDM